jgi:hypothetical protein
MGDNQLTIIISIISALFGGGFVAIVNYVTTKRIIDADSDTRAATVEKLKAETEQIHAETDRIRGSVEQVKSEQEKAGKDIQSQAKEIDWIKTMIKLLISDYERLHLQNLVSEKPFIAEVKQGSTFEWELRHLLTLNFIDRLPHTGMRTLFKIGKCDIKEHLQITEQGRNYLKVLHEIENS